MVNTVARPRIARLISAFHRENYPIRQLADEVINDIHNRCQLPVYTKRAKISNCMFSRRAA